MTVIWWTTTFFVGGGIGLVVGWLLLPQPRFVTWFAEKLHIKDRAP